MQDIVFDYTNYGWELFPVLPNKKRPATPNGFHDATCDAEAIRRWREDIPDANIGLRTGKASEVFVLDIDIKNGAPGMDSLAELEEVHGELPATLSATTPSGGCHYFFRYPEAGVRCRTNLMPGIDIRGDGGYVVVAPSQVDGQSYKWVDREQEIASAPSWLVEMIASKAPADTRLAGSALSGLAEGQRNDGIFRFAASLRARGVRYEEAEILLYNAADRASPPLDHKEAKQCLESAYGRYEPGVIRPFTDLGNAERIVDRFGTHIRYVPEYGNWLVWDNSRWAHDQSGLIYQLAKSVVRSIPSESQGGDNPQLSEQLSAFARKSEQRSKLEAMIDLASKEPPVPLSASQLDADPWKLNVTNAVIDLQTGESLQPSPQMHMTKQVNIEYDAAAICPRWEQFLKEITGNDQQVADFLQRAVGYTLTGKTSEQSLFILHGTGANGKSTFMDILMRLLGDYAKTVASETLMAQRVSNSSGPSEDVARLHGARLAATTETEEGQVLAEALVKRMTGEDTLVARIPYAKHSVEFKPSFKVWVAANHRPTVKGDDHAIWRRLLLVPFDQRFEGKKQDKALRSTLESELPGILNWAIEGCLQWQTQGLNPPASIRAASEEYRTDMDLLGEWIESSCATGSDEQASVTHLYESYCTWCFRNHTKPVDRRIFGRKLKSKGYTSCKITGSRGYKGIAPKHKTPISISPESRLAVE